MRYFVLIFAILVASPSFAVSICKNCTITGIQPDVRHGGTYIWVDGDWGNSDTECSTPNSKAFFVPVDSTLEEQIISIALAAFVAKKTVGYILGTGTCSSNNYETVSYFYIKD